MFKRDDDTGINGTDSTTLHVLHSNTSVLGLEDGLCVTSGETLIMT